ncbi:MAG: veratrol--corrinoid protein metyltransferase [Coriobacteriia bacterium]|nr:veratrol--corrinoid protein metyltransferase [Coriobacteriia bacterium]
MLSVRDNFMRLANREVPEYIPEYNMMWAFNMPPMLMGERNPDGSGKSIFGVESVLPSGVLNVPMPKTHDFILTDITKWRDVIKVPVVDLDDSAWQDLAKQANDRRNPDLPFGGTTTMGFFQNLVAFMGFTEGLSACFEEPEEVKDLLNYLCDFYEGLAKKMVQFYNLDFGYFGDDIAHERNPFLSLEMFQDIFAPVWRRYYAVFVEAGLPCGHHNCGHFELYLDDLVDMGVSFWDPVQASNDEAAIKEKFGTNLAMCSGGLDFRMMPDGTSEEEVRFLMREYMDKMAPGGGFALFEYSPMGMAAFTEAEIERAGWAYDEFEKRRYDYYK